MSVPVLKKKKDDSFKEFVLDALSGLSGVRSRAMFGGHGLYLGDTFFGLISGAALYFRVDDATRPDYAARGSRPFTYSRDGKETTMAYFEVPADVLEDHRELALWAERAAAAARAAKVARKKRP